MIRVEFEDHTNLNSFFFNTTSACYDTAKDEAEMFLRQMVNARQLNTKDVFIKYDRPNGKLQAVRDADSSVLMSCGDKTIVLYGVNGDRECTHRTLLIGDIKHTAYGEWYLLKVHDVGWGPWGSTTPAILTIAAKNNKVNYEADSVF